MNSDHAGTTGAMFPAMGFWTAVLLVVLNAAYIGVMALSFASFPPHEPLQSITHILILVTVPSLIILWTQLHDAAAPDRKLFSHASLAFLIAFAALVSINRFVALVVVGPTLASGNVEGLRWFSPYEWPSVMLALELLGWGFFGIACLTMAPVFQESSLERAICWTLVASAAFNLAIIVCLIMGLISAIWLLAPMAWGLAPTAAFVMIAVWFRKQM